MSPIEKARQLLEQTRNKVLTSEERKEKAIQLAALMVHAANQEIRPEEKRLQRQLGSLMKDPAGKTFVTAVTDQCFRSKEEVRVADQLVYLIDTYGIPDFFSWQERLKLTFFKYFGKKFPRFLVPLVKQALRQETNSVIIPGEAEELVKHLQRRYGEDVRLNLNHLGEAILGEAEALKRLRVYEEDLTKDNIEYISVKISTICSQLNLLSWDHTLEILAERLRILYRVASAHRFTRQNGEQVEKFVNLDMEEYRDVELTVALFKKVLDEKEFKHYSAGIVLQSYLPDSYAIQQQLTTWARARVADGGAPIKIRLVKGANLAMEALEASLHGWPQAPYPNKMEVDANYKQMILYGLNPSHVKAAWIGIASHNVFDIAYALLLRMEYQLEKESCFEMLEGMADPMRRVVQQLAGDILLYCPVATKEDFVSAVAYLMRRLDENTAPENFLRSSFQLEPGSPSWKDQEERFRESCDSINHVDNKARRTQNRQQYPSLPCFCAPFSNEPDTDFSLEKNRLWAKKITEKWKNFEGKTVSISTNADDVEPLLKTATTAFSEWKNSSVEERAFLLSKVAQKMREQRGNLIGVMMVEGKKIVTEADAEISEAIDFLEYYRRVLLELHSFNDIAWRPKGIVLVAPPWNFPCSIPTGGIAAALATGNAVIFKPAPETREIGKIIAEIFFEAGVDKKILQFFCCEDDPVGTRLVKDPRIAVILLTGATDTARLFLKMNPFAHLYAETGGKNSIIVTKMADRDLAIKDIVHSAFGHAGQKCSACSIAILESEVYDDPHFRKQLRDAAASLTVGSSWNLATKVNPLIRLPERTLIRGLTELDSGEEWLLQPQQDDVDSNLWTPGIRLGVVEGSFMHTTELFGPVLCLMRARDLTHALQLANGTKYGLTSGIETLDPREAVRWEQEIEAGNLYINRTITGAIVQRQPFGGCKASSFGRGAKAGGPNYLTQLMHAQQLEGSDQMDAVESYQFYWDEYFSKKHDPSLLIGQDNFLKYVPRKAIVLRVTEQDCRKSIARVIAACRICRTPLEISIEKGMSGINFPHVKEESVEELFSRLEEGVFVRMLAHQNKNFLLLAAEKGISLLCGAVLANGRLELLNYLREVSVSIDYHRYGNLGEREGEQRQPLSMPDPYCSNSCD